MTKRLIKRRGWVAIQPAAAQSKAMIFQTLYLYYLTVRPTRTLLCLMTNLQNDSCQSIKTAKDHATELQKYEPSRGSFSGYKMPQYRLQSEIQTQVYENCWWQIRKMFDVYLSNWPKIRQQNYKNMNSQTRESFSGHEMSAFWLQLEDPTQVYEYVLF